MSIYSKSYFSTHLDHYGPNLYEFTQNHSPRPLWSDTLFTAIFIWYSKSYFWTHMDYYRLKWTKTDPFHIHLFKTIRILDHYGPILLGSGQNHSSRPIWTQFVCIVDLPKVTLLDPSRPLWAHFV